MVLIFKGQSKTIGKNPILNFAIKIKLNPWIVENIRLQILL